MKEHSIAEEYVKEGSGRQLLRAVKAPLLGLGYIVFLPMVSVLAAFLLTIKKLLGETKPRLVRRLQQ